MHVYNSLCGWIQDLVTLVNGFKTKTELRHHNNVPLVWRKPVSSLEQAAGPGKHA